MFHQVYLKQERVKAVANVKRGERYDQSATVTRRLGQTSSGPSAKNQRLEQIKKTFNYDNKINSSELLHTIKFVDVLVIGDLGVENVAAWVEQLFTNLLKYRLTKKQKDDLKRKT